VYPVVWVSAGGDDMIGVGGRFGPARLKNEPRRLGFNLVHAKQSGGREWNV
jgi:hypothetical protein